MAHNTVISANSVVIDDGGVSIEFNVIMAICITILLFLIYKIYKTKV
jgi:hypothetical protein